MASFGFCCCGDCQCLGCISFNLSDARAAGNPGPVDAAIVDATYQRQVRLWKRTGGDKWTPYDLFSNPAVDCAPFGLSEEDYPGTQCVYVADLCCSPSPQDDPPSGDPVVEAPPPPPPPPP